jgi:hypothetical protein
MKTLITFLAAAGLVLALAPAAQAELIAHTGFEDPAAGVSDFTPSGTDTEIGFSVPAGGDFKVINSSVITAPHAFRMQTSPLKQNPGPGAPVTFDTVGLSGFSGVELSIDVNVVVAVYEGYDGGDGGEAYRVFLDLFDGTSNTTVTVFDSWVSIGDLDNVDTLGTQTYTFSIPDKTVSATASVFWNGNSSSGEGMVIDNLTFNGTPGTPGTMISAQ